MGEGPPCGGALGHCASALDALHRQRATPISGSRLWLESWTRAYCPPWEPWVLVIAGGRGPVAIAPLARRRVAGMVQITSLGGPSPDHSPVVAADEPAAHELAEAITRDLDAMRRPWSLHLPQIEQGDPLLDALAARLPHHLVAAGSDRPRLRIRERNARGYLSRNIRSSAARHRNLIARHGRQLDVAWEEDRGTVLGHLDEIIDVHRQRDLDLRGATTLDDPHVDHFYRQVLTDHEPQLRLLTVRIDGALAAYTLCLRRDRELFVYDNRMNPALAAYAPGLLATVETVVHTMTDDTLDLVDWGAGRQRFKLGCANEVESMTRFTAWSSRTVQRTLDLRRRLIAPSRTR